MFSNLVGKERKFRNLINGQWCNSKSKEFIEIRSPINQEIVGRVPAMTREEVDEKLHQIMSNIHETCVKFGEEPNGKINYVKGANISGFVKVAEAMMAQGVV